MSPFFIFRLPQLLLKLTLDLVDNGDIAQLSLCSERTYNVIKKAKRVVSLGFLSKEQADGIDALGIITLLQREAHISSQQFCRTYSNFLSIILYGPMSLSIRIKDALKATSFSVCVESRNKQNCDNEIKKDLRIGDIIIPIVRTNGNVMYTFWDNEVNRFEVLANYFNRFFNPEIECIYIDMNCQPPETRISSTAENSLRSVLNWVISTDKPVKDCNVFGKSFEDKDFKFILDRVHPTRNMLISTIQSKEFEYNGKINSPRLYLYGVEWFTIDNLFNTDSESICIEQSNLNNNDLKRYVEAWMERKFPRLKSLSVQIPETVNVPFVLSGLSGYEEFPLSFIPHLRIQQREGVTAHIEYPNRSPTTFEMSIY